MGSVAPKKGLFFRFLDRVEYVGNKMPPPVILFLYLAFFVIVLSFAGSILGWTASGEVIKSGTGTLEMQTITVRNLLSTEGFVYILTSMMRNFMNFAPLGVVLLVTFGIGLAEDSGYISTMVKVAVQRTSSRWVTPVVVFLGVMSNVASVVGYVILIPLGAIIFLSFKKHPLAGMAAAFAGCSGGFSANLLIGPIDPLLSGITTEAVKILQPGYAVDPTANWFFMMVSTLLVTAAGTWVTERIVIPRLGQYDESQMDQAHDDAALRQVSEKERLALRMANYTFLALIALLVLACLPETSPLRNAKNGSLISGSPLMQSVIPIVMLMFFIPSYVFGKVSGSIKDTRDLARSMNKSMSTMGAYVALAFAASQFIAYFDYTNIGLIISLKGATLLQAINLYPPLLAVLFVLICAFLNLFMGSASAKWVILAPVFVPMFMKLGLSPELTQAAFRIGDSSTNIITPLMDYFPLILAFAQKYDKNVGMGTMISTMIPYSVYFLLGWSILLGGWMIAELPLGPGVGVYMP